MYNIFLLITVLLFSNSLYASEERCKSILTDNHERTSSVFSINLDKLELRDYKADHLASSIAIVRSLISEAGCSRADINFGKGPSGRSKNRCFQTVKYKPHTRVCVIETNLGLFIVKKDFQSIVNIIFENWD